MQFVFVRHGQPEWFRDGAAVDNPGLTDVGWAQAAHLGRRFRRETADAVLVSPLVRARQTAQPIGEALGLEPVVCDWLPEIRSPEWHGAPLGLVQQIFAEHREKEIDDIWKGLDGGESYHDFHERVTTGLQRFLDLAGKPRVLDQPALWESDPTDAADPDRPPRRIVIVAHGGTDAALIGYLLGIPPTPWEWERFISYHASVSEVNPINISGRHAYSLVRLSDVSHLPPGIQTA